MRCWARAFLPSWGGAAVATAKRDRAGRWSRIPGLEGSRPQAAPGPMRSYRYTTSRCPLSALRHVTRKVSSTPRPSPLPSQRNLTAAIPKARLAARGFGRLVRG